LKLYADGVALWGKGDYHTAMRQYEAAAADDAEFAMAHAALGNAYTSFIYNDRVRGRQHLDRAIALAGRTTERERLAIQITHAINLGTPEQAERLYRLYLSQYPDDAPMRYNFGSTLMRQDRFREAVDELSEVVRVVPTFASAYVNLATCLSSERRHAQALASYEKAFAIEPSWKLGGNLNHEYGFALVEAGDHRKAREVFGLAAARPADKARALRSMALLDVMEGRFRRAAEAFREAALTNEAAKIGVSAARDRLLLAATLGAMNDRRGSLRELEAASRLLEGGAPQVWMLARVGQGFARAGAMRRAEQLLASAKAHLEENNAQQAAEAHVLEGEIELARGRAARAVEHFDRAYRARPWPLTLEPLARGEAAAGDADRSLEHYRALMGLGHRCSGWEAQAPWLAAHYDFARLLAESGDRDLARTTIDELLTLWKESDGSPGVLKPARALRASLD
jgi:tetratricopeptide (TPR) repeat protein